MDATNTTAVPTGAHCCSACSRASTGCGECDVYTCKDWTLRFNPAEHLASAVAQLGTLGSLDMPSEVYSDMAVQGSCVATLVEGGAIDWFASFPVEGIRTCNINSTAGGAEEDRILFASVIAPAITDRHANELLVAAGVATSHRILTRNLKTAVDDAIAAHEGEAEGASEEKSDDVGTEYFHAEYIKSLVAAADARSVRFVRVPVSAYVECAVPESVEGAYFMIAVIRRTRHRGSAAESERGSMTPAPSSVCTAAPVPPAVVEGAYVCGFGFRLDEIQFERWCRERIASESLDAAVI